MHLTDNTFKKKAGFWAALLMMMLIMVLQFYHRINGTNQKYFSETVQISAFSMTLIAGIAFLALFALITLAIFSKIQKETIYLSGFLLIGTIFVFIFAPATSPDEPVHFQSAYYLSNLLCCPLRQLNLSGKVLLRSEDYHYFTQIISITQSRENYLSILDNFQWFDHSLGYQEFNGGTAIGNAPLGYLVGGIVIAIGRLLHLGFYPIYYLGRLANVFAYAFITYYAMKRTPIGKNVIFIISFLPMTLHVTASFSYDCYAIAFTTLFVSEILRTIYFQNPLTKKQFAALTVLGFMVAITKVVYIPILLSFFLIPNSRIADTSKKAILAKFAMLFACIILFLAVSLSQLTSNLTSENLTYTDSQSFTLNWVLHNIASTIIIFVRTLVVNREIFFLEMLGVSLGWFQIYLNDGILYFFAFILLICCGTDLPTAEQPTVFVRCTAALAVAASVGLVLASMFFAWTPFGSTIIAGVQGRYFIPLLYPLGIALQNSILKIDEKYIRYLFPSVFVLCFSCILNIVYYSYSYIP